MAVMNHISTWHKKGTVTGAALGLSIYPGLGIGNELEQGMGTGPEFGNGTVNKLGLGTGLVLGMGIGHAPDPVKAPEPSMGTSLALSALELAIDAR